jgi:hypothetical protein
VTDVDNFEDGTTVINKLLDTPAWQQPRYKTPQVAEGGVGEGEAQI